MNDALRGFKKATDQVRIHFDARELISDDVKHLLDNAAPLDDFMLAILYFYYSVEARKRPLVFIAGRGNEI